MVKEGFNTAGNDINIGVNILVSLSLDDEHREHSGEYFDNDIGAYSAPKADGRDAIKSKKIVSLLEDLI